MNENRAIKNQLARLENEGLIIADTIFGDLYGYMFSYSGLELLAALGIDTYWTPARYCAYILYGDFAK